MTWTRDPAPSGDWLIEPDAASAWGRAAAAYGSWLTERTGSTRRITQDGRRRITEQGSTRIIERFETSWSLDPPAAGTWT